MTYTGKNCGGRVHWKWQTISSKNEIKVNEQSWIQRLFQGNKKKPSYPSLIPLLVRKRAGCFPWKRRDSSVAGIAYLSREISGGFHAARERRLTVDSRMRRFYQISRWRQTRLLRGRENPSPLSPPRRLINHIRGETWVREPVRQPCNSFFFSFLFLLPVLC